MLSFSLADQYALLFWDKLQLVFAYSFIYLFIFAALETDLGKVFPGKHVFTHAI